MFRNMFQRVVYRALSDLSGKGAFFVVTVVAAHRLTQQDFGIFSVATTLGWMVGVATDFGMQLHLARTVARHPERAPETLRIWLRLRLATAAAAVMLVA